MKLKSATLNNENVIGTSIVAHYDFFFLNLKLSLKKPLYALFAFIALKVKPFMTFISLLKIKCFKFFHIDQSI